MRVALNGLVVGLKLWEDIHGMGVVEHRNGRRVTLGAHNEVGRSRKSVVQLTDTAASAHHAVVSWREGGWFVRDLGSRNGTLVADEPIPVGDYVFLSSGSSLMFGGGGERWTLVDDASPAARAICDASVVVAIGDGMLLPLPDAQRPEACVYLEDASGWQLEHGDELRAVSDHDEVVLASGRWRLELPPVLGGSVSTTRAVDNSVRVLDHMECRFRVSRDEEHIELTLIDDIGELPLGSRAHHELLLALARVRLRDSQQGLAPGECGWIYVDDVAKMLAIDPQNLTVTVFRARKQIAEAGVFNAAALIERRPRPRQLRIGPRRVSIESF